MSAPELTEAEAAVVARFDAAEEPAEVTREKLRLAEEALQRVRVLLDHMARNRAYDLGTVQVVRRALDGA